MTKVLVENGANVNSKTNRGNTPLHLVGQNEVIVKLLLEGGALSDTKNQKGETPLSYAEKGGNVRIVEIIEKWGVQVLDA